MQIEKNNLMKTQKSETEKTQENYNNKDYDLIRNYANILNGITEDHDDMDYKKD